MLFGRAVTRRRLVTMNDAGSLPDPDPAALERTAALAALIRTEITASATGAIGFDRYMEMALYEPGLGYYAAGETIFGASGDFVTAPESGTLFARCLQRQCAEILSHGGTRIVEYGAGSGRLATLLGAALLGDDPRLAYELVEPSAPLRARQRALVAAQETLDPARFSWSETHPDDAFSGVVVANEVIDAMPARRYQVSGGSVHELGVGLDGERFVWRVLPDRAVPTELAAALRGYPDGYRCERHPGLHGWCRALHSKLRSGVVLISDYGYAGHEFLHPDRSDGTLKCHYRHLVHADPFLLPGLQDLTVAVDFSDLAEASHAAGFRVAGFTTQARFLIACGIDAILAEAEGRAVLDIYALAQEAKRLLLPGEMGQTCKFMALAVDYDAPLSGFADDERHRLGGFSSD